MKKETKTHREGTAGPLKAPPWRQQGAMHAQADPGLDGGPGKYSEL